MEATAWQVKWRNRFNRLTGPARMLPHFLILGAMRSGTSSLFRILSQHPQVMITSVKELHFFDLQFHHGLNWYRSHFPLRFQAHLRSMATGKRIITGEGSPYYLFHPHASRRIAATLPKVKLIAILRNPVDRAYSHYQYKMLGKEETLSFEEAIAREPERLAGEREKMLADERYHSVRHQNFSYLARGLYAEQLQAYSPFFPREQMLVIASEDYYRNPAKVYGQVLDFLGLDRFPPPPAGPRHKNPYAPMADATRARLREYFAPHNQRLYDHLSVDFGW